MRIGYGRVSTTDQNLDAQRDALLAAGCDQVLVDKASRKLARRPELDKALLIASLSFRDWSAGAAVSPCSDSVSSLCGCMT